MFGLLRSLGGVCIAAKKPDMDLFDTMDATDLNKRLKDLMDGLSVKVLAMSPCSPSTRSLPSRQAGLRVSRTLQCISPFCACSWIEIFIRGPCAALIAVAGI